jgi:hypothetical protein
MIGAFLVPVAFFAVLAILGAPFARALARRMELRDGGVDHSSRDVLSRLERIEQAIDAMAVEVERISEAQRFTTRLLADRADVATGDHAVARRTSAHRP